MDAMNASCEMFSPIGVIHKAKPISSVISLCMEIPFQKTQARQLAFLVNTRSEMLKHSTKIRIPWRALYTQ